MDTADLSLPTTSGGRKRTTEKETKQQTNKAKKTGRNVAPTKPSTKKKKSGKGDQGADQDQIDSTGKKKGRGGNGKIKLGKRITVQGVRELASRVFLREENAEGWLQSKLATSQSILPSLLTQYRHLIHGVSTKELLIICYVLMYYYPDPLMHDLLPYLEMNITKEADETYVNHMILNTIREHGKISQAYALWRSQPRLGGKKKKEQPPANDDTSSLSTSDAGSPQLSKFLSLNSNMYKRSTIALRSVRPLGGKRAHKIEQRTMDVQPPLIDINGAEQDAEAVYREKHGFEINLETFGKQPTFTSSEKKRVGVCDTKVTELLGKLEKKADSWFADGFKDTSEHTLNTIEDSGYARMIAMRRIQCPLTYDEALALSLATAPRVKDPLKAMKNQHGLL